MAQTKLETYVDILKTLANRGPLKNSVLAGELKIDAREMKRYLSFILKQGLVDESRVGNQRAVYSVTRRGIAVLRCFGELKQERRLFEENPQI